jgi:hypothetical protein
MRKEKNSLDCSVSQMMKVFFPRPFYSEWNYFFFFSFLFSRQEIKPLEGNTEPENVEKLEKLKNDVEDVKKKSIACKGQIEIQEKLVDTLEKKAAHMINRIGSVVSDIAPVTDDEEHNLVLRTWGTNREEPNLLSHVDLIRMIDGVEYKHGFSFSCYFMSFFLSLSFFHSLFLFFFSSPGCWRAGFLFEGRRGAVMAWAAESGGSVHDEEGVHPHCPSVLYDECSDGGVCTIGTI